MEFTKMQGAANDFVMVDARNLEKDWSRLAIAVCNRQLGIGCDSLIILLDSIKADIAMRTFDADGSEAETCGNGIRCVARYMLEKGMISPDTKEITIETNTAVNRVSFETHNGRVTKFWANMGKPQLAADKIPVIIETNGHNGTHLISHPVSFNGTRLTLNFVSMGNPHAVFFTDSPVADFPMAKIGPLVENLPILPRKTNFEVARVIDRSNVEARVWERGVGETKACGSGVGAITMAGNALGYTGEKVDVRFPGGTLHAEINVKGEMIVGGPAEVVFEGVWPD